MKAKWIAGCVAFVAFGVIFPASVFAEEVVNVGGANGRAASRGQGVNFTGLGHLPGGDFVRSEALAVSADGLVVVGESFLGPDHGAFRWTEQTGMVSLGELAGGGFRGSALAVSADGSVVVGESGSAMGIEAFRWTEESGMARLGRLEGGQGESMGTAVSPHLFSHASGVSADGSVVVGYSYGTAFRWTQATGMVDLGHLGEVRLRTSASGVSADGSVVVGSSDWVVFTDPIEVLNGAFRWTQDEGMVGLGDLPGGDFYSRALAVSADGLVAVGWSKSAWGTEAFRWTQDRGMVGLGDLPGGEYDSIARDVSADGSVVVGAACTGPTFSRADHRAFIWDQGNGMRSLRDVLVNDCGLDLTGWTLHEAFGISDDGSVIVGAGINPEGISEGWVATIPGPSALALLAAGTAFALNRRRNRRRAGALQS